jgi:spore germination protein
MNDTFFSRWYHRSPATVWGAAALAALLLTWWITNVARGPAAPMPLGTGSKFQIVAFYENPSSGAPGSSSSFVKNVRAITTVSPRWFSMTGSGAVTDIGFDPTTASFAKSHHVLLVPLVTNAGSSMLTSASVRSTAAANLAAIVRRDHLNGVNIDFELLPPSERAGLTDFVAILRHDLGPKPVLAVSVFPLVGMPASVNGAYDYAGLAKNANYLVIMAYDHHYNGGPPGPVAPYSWVVSNVDAALRQVPAPKLVLAIGMYGYDWVGTNGATVSDAQAEALAAAHGVKPTYVAGESQNTFQYTSGGTTHVVWYMGDRSAKARMDLARSRHLAGLALWRLGDEDSRFWSTLGLP